MIGFPKCAHFTGRSLVLVGLEGEDIAGEGGFALDDEGALELLQEYATLIGLYRGGVFSAVGEEKSCLIARLAESLRIFSPLCLIALSLVGEVCCGAVTMEFGEV